MLDLSVLNTPQREAVEHHGGPLLVLAGAGSGKTRVITYRVARLLERGMPAKQILALSFTNKAAAEMRSRVVNLVGKAGERVWMGTFHALGHMLLKEAHEADQIVVGKGKKRKKTFTIYDAADQLGLVRELLRHVKVDDRRFDPKAILFRISHWKNALRSPEQVSNRKDLERDEYDEIAAIVYEKYEEALRNFSAYDFDDLIVVPVRMALPAWQERWRHVLVDEYQDTNQAQFALIRHLCGEGHNLCVVGDDDQSIYGWRGAEAKHILGFERHFRGTRVVKLEENYRSRPQILAAASALIAHNRQRYDKTLWTQRQPGPSLRAVVLEDPETEANYVATEIRVLGVRPDEVAILYRSNIQARVLEDALREANLPYRVTGGQAFYERKEVKDVIAYLRAAMFPDDEIALRRIVNYPTRGIGPVKLEHAKTAGPTLREGLRQVAPEFSTLLDDLGSALANGCPGRATELLVEKIALYDDLRSAAPSLAAADRRIGNVKDFIRSLENRRELRNYLHLLTLGPSANSDEEDEMPPAVTLTTFHGSKGLEFPVVFLVGLEEGLLPHKRTVDPIATDIMDRAVDIEEERRLLYVGITRARENLYLTRARTRSKNGRPQPVTPSRFWSELPESMLDTEERKEDPGVVDACMAQLRALMAGT